MPHTSGFAKTNRRERFFLAVGLLWGRLSSPTALFQVLRLRFELRTSRVKVHSILWYLLSILTKLVLHLTIITAKFLQVESHLKIPVSYSPVFFSFYIFTF